MRAHVRLDDGTVFDGCGFGAEGTASGDVVTWTSPTGYQEAITDPANASKIILFTAPHIGNTGINHEDSISGSTASGIIVRDPTPRASSHRKQEEFADWLVQMGVVGVYDVDTRAIAHRARGGIRATVTNEEN